MSLNVSDEAVSAINNASAMVEETHEQLRRFAQTLNTTFQENQNGLGRHHGTIQELLDSLVSTSGDEKHVKKLVKKLTMSSKIIAAHIAENVYSGQGRTR